VIVDMLLLPVDLLEGLAAVFGHPEPHLHRVDGVEIVGIASQFVPVVATRRVVRTLLPALSAVERAEDPSLVSDRVDHAVNHVGVDR